MMLIDEIQVLEPRIGTNVHDPRNFSATKFVNNSQELRPINGQYLSHMCTSVNPNTNQPGSINYQSVVLTFDTVSYRANWYSLTFDTDPSYCFISQAR